jgi:hypothetical protein
MKDRTGFGLRAKAEATQPALIQIVGRLAVLHFEILP